jgi:hypothetical protein
LEGKTNAKRDVYRTDHATLPAANPPVTIEPTARSTCYQRDQ